MLKRNSFVEFIVIAPPSCECKDNSREIVLRLSTGRESTFNLYTENLFLISVIYRKDLYTNDISDIYGKK